MKESLKIEVDKKILSSLKKEKVNWEKYIESLIVKDTSLSSFQSLIDKLAVGYNLGGFKRDDAYDRY